LVKYRLPVPATMVAVTAVALACAGATGFLLLDRVDATFGALLAAVALIIAVVDLERFEIPDLASVAMFVLGIAWTQAFGFDVEGLGQALLRALLVAAVLLAVRTAYRALRKVEGLGLGDVKLAGAGAVWLSYPHIAFAFLIAVGAAFALILSRSIIAGERIRKDTAVPFGTFLAPAVWMAWLAQVHVL
jgi:leader peptidase (prepilin peptidase) / N-methyltransferase